MKLICLCALIALAQLARGGEKYPELPLRIADESPAQQQHRLAWWQDARFGMFVHFGLYAVPARHEWIRYYERIDNETYDKKYLPRFNPDLYDARAWVAAAKNAGMKYIVLTAKHHEGFCMWDTATTEYKITRTEFGRDVVREFVDACREQGIRIGLYFSIVDWHHPDYTIDYRHPAFRMLQDEGLAGEAMKKKILELNAKRDMNRYRTYMFAQVRELLSNYGTIDIVWFDFTPVGNDPEWCKTYRDWDAVELVRMARKLQPGILIDDRLDLRETDDGWDFVTPEQYKVQNPPKLRGRCVPWETCQTFSGSWGYHRDENTWKSVPQLLELLVHTVSMGGNLILNVGPTARGEFDRRAKERLEGFADWMHVNSRAIYGCTRAPAGFTAPNGTLLTYNPKTNRLYIHLIDYPLDRLPVAFFDQIEYAQFLHDGSELKLDAQSARQPGSPDEKDEYGSIALPVLKPAVEIPVVEVWLKPAAR